MRLRFFTTMVTLLLAVISTNAIFAQDGAPPFLGIQFGPDGEAGVIIGAVVPDGPAEEAGIQANDVIVTLEDSFVSADNLVTLLGNFSAGDTVEMGVYRAGESLLVDVTLGERPADFDSQQAEAPEIAPTPADPRPRLGVAVDNALEDQPGAVILNVVPDSPADEAGIQVDDVVVRVDETDIATANDLIEIISGYVPGDIIEIEVLRDEETQLFEVELAEAPPVEPIQLPDVDELIVDPTSLSFDSDTNTWTVENAPEGSPIFEEGLQEGDVITAVNGEEVMSDEDLFGILTEGLLGESLTIEVDRDGESIELEVSTDLVAAMLFSIEAN